MTTSHWRYMLTFLCTISTQMHYCHKQKQSREQTWLKKLKNGRNKQWERRNGGNCCHFVQVSHALSQVLKSSIGILPCLFFGLLLLLLFFKEKKTQGTQYIVVMITEGDTRQDIPSEKTGRLLSRHLCLQLQSGECTAAIPSLPSMVSSVHLY